MFLCVRWRDSVARLDVGRVFLIFERPMYISMCYRNVLCLSNCKLLLRIAIVVLLSCYEFNRNARWVRIHVYSRIPIPDADPPQLLCVFFNSILNHTHAPAGWMVSSSCNAQCRDALQFIASVVHHACSAGQIGHYRGVFLPAHCRRSHVGVYQRRTNAPADNAWFLDAFFIGGLSSLPLAALCSCRSASWRAESSTAFKKKKRTGSFKHNTLRLPVLKLIT